MRLASAPTHLLGRDVVAKVGHEPRVGQHVPIHLAGRMGTRCRWVIEVQGCGGERMGKGCDGGRVQVCVCPSPHLDHGLVVVDLPPPRLLLLPVLVRPEGVAVPGRRPARHVPAHVRVALLPSINRYRPSRQLGMLLGSGSKKTPAAAAAPPTAAAPPPPAATAGGSCIGTCCSGNRNMTGMQPERMASKSRFW